MNRVLLWSRRVWSSQTYNGLSKCEMKLKFGSYKLDVLSSSRYYGSLGPEGITVSIIGPPNAGKSTLFNRLLCKESNRAYRLASEKKIRIKKGVSSTARVGASGTVRKKSNRGGAIVSDVPGTTRDRRESIGRIGGCYFRMVDTAGVDGDRLDSYFSEFFKNRQRVKSSDEIGLEAAMINQTLEAVRSSDLVLLMFDAKLGVTSDIAEIARWLRKTSSPMSRSTDGEYSGYKVLILANKLEGDSWVGSYDGHTPVMTHLDEAARIGFGDAIPISAEHGEGLADIAAVIEELTKMKREKLGLNQISSETNITSNAQAKPLQLAILGRQNVGKSSLVNALLRQNRVITGKMPGLTRDSIGVKWNWNGQEVKIVDTAGIRKISQRVRENEIEDLAVLDAVRAMKVADVAVLVLDAGAGVLQRQELVIADAVVKEGRSLVVAANKWDLLENTSLQQYAQGVRKQIELRLPMLRETPVVAMSAIQGQGVDDLMPVVFTARERWERMIPTGILNRWLLDLVNANPPPLTNGRPTRIKYIIQTKGRPPTFLLFCNVDEIPKTYLRFIINRLQDTFQMFGMEARFAIKRSSKENPYHTPKTRKTYSSGIGGATARKDRNVALLRANGNLHAKRRSRSRIQRKTGRNRQHFY